MKITTVMEDTIQKEGLCAEHGLSVYVETKHHKLLVDTGASEKTWENARALGIELKDIDLVILSHGHYDHGGGLQSFVKINPNARIYLHKEAGGPYYNLKNGQEKYIGIEPSLLTLSQIVPLAGDTRIDEEIFVFSEGLKRRMWPAGNETLKKKENGRWVPDDFCHEQYVVLEEDGEYTLISGCAHRGILNILERFHEIYGRYPAAVYSGFHLNKDGYTKEEIQAIEDTAKELGQTGCEFYTGHCTTEPALSVFREILGERFHYLGKEANNIINE